MVDLLLELSSKSGRQVREYAFVLDTPESTPDARRGK